MKRNPKVVIPIWNYILNQIKNNADIKETKLLQVKLDGACAKFNKIKIEEMGKSNIIEDVEEMAKKVTSILEQKNISKANIDSVNQELSQLSSLDCRFQRLGDFYDKEIRDLRKELEASKKKNDEKMKKINDQLKKYSEDKRKLEEKYRKAEVKISGLEEKTRGIDKSKFEDKTGKDTLSKLFQLQKQTMLDLRNDNVRLHAEVEHLNLTANQVLVENIHLSEAMAEVKEENVHVRAQLECITARLDNLGGTLNEKLDEIIKNQNTKKD